MPGNAMLLQPVMEPRRGSNLWRRDALCARHDPELWHLSGVANYSHAIHKCLRHCPVLDQCRETARVEYAAGLKPIETVVAGTRFGSSGQPKRTDVTGMRCEHCGPLPEEPIEVTASQYRQRRKEHQRTPV